MVWKPTRVSLCDITSVSADQWGRGDIVPVKTVVPSVKAAWFRVWQLLLLWLHHVYPGCEHVQSSLTTVTFFEGLIYIHL